MTSIDQIKELRNATGASVTECKKALQEASGDLEKARQVLKKLGQDVANKVLGRDTKEGIIDSYIHAGKKIGVLLELNCQSDFVARSKEFRALAHELCLQIAAFHDQATDLMEQVWIKDPSRTIKDLVQEYIGKFGENIIVKRYTRYEL